MNLLEQAISLAVEAHAGQVRKDGTPYILHPLQVMLQMESEVEQITAVLHDVVEDTAVTFADLQEMDLPPEALEAIRLLTHEDGVPYEDYIMNLKASPIARRVKLADLKHNMDVSALPQLGEKDVARLRRYGRAWRLLQS